MPANNPSPTSKAPLSPDSKNVSKYANKDGSKFIALPKPLPAAETSQATTPTSATMPSTQSSVIGPASNGPPPGVNAKKQKRRQKIAAKAAAAAAAANGRTSPSTSVNARSSSTGHASAVSAIENEDDAEDPRPLPQAEPSHASSHSPNGIDREHDATVPDIHSKKSKKKKNKKKKGNAAGVPEQQSQGVTYRQHHEVARPQTNDRFWNTNSNEERERIKAFWISLSEDERKNLVKLEKDTILKKMKEQQKNTCSCAVCGRKRSAIEQELEGLYDSYYRELENYANRADGSLIGGPGNFALQPPREPHIGYPGPVPARGRLVEHVHEVEDDEEDSYVEEEYEDEDEVYSEDELSDDERRPDDRVIADFLDFGNSLQVKGGILTVADDLLKNDGRKFIEMMEQLAERRMARDEAPPGHYPRIVGGHRSNGYLPPHNHIHDDEEDEHDHHHEHGHHHEHDHEHDEHDHIHDDDHDHGHIHDHHDHHLHDHIHDHHHLHDDDPDGEYAEDDEEEYDESQEGEYDDEEDEVEEAMTDQQRMEEGRRMFQIFAARMFEQRVLSAYKKKLASERTEKLLQELDDEKRLEEERKASKASKAAKKRDRERQKKLAAQEAKAKKEAEKAAEEAAKKAEVEKKAEEQRRQVEEKRKAKEAAKKREEEERHRKEAERLKRAQEQERKAREARESKEREKKLKEEQKQKEKEAREAKDRQAREQKERQLKEREQKEREARERKEKQEAERLKKSEAKLDKDKQKAQAKSAANAKASSAQGAVPKGSKKQGQQPPAAPQAEKQPPTTMSLPQHPAPTPTANYASPKVAVATPIIPPRAVAHPIRSRTSSQQQDSASGTGASHQGSATSHSGSPHASTPLHSSPGAIGSHSGSHMAPGMPGVSQQAPQSGSPSISSLRASSLNTASPPPFPIGRAGGMPPPPPGFPQMPMPPGLQNRMPQDQVFPPGQGAFRYGPDMMHLPPGLAPPLGRAAYGGPPPPPGFSQPAGDPLLGLNPGFGLPSDIAPPTQQPRQMSTGMDPLSASSLSGQPISRPTPIGRPSSVVHGQRPGDNSHESAEDESEHLGSRALLDDEPDDPVSLGQGSFRQRAAPGVNIRTQFPPPSGFIDQAFGSPFHTQWGSPGSSFTPQSGLGGSLWSAGANNHFAAPGAPGAPLRPRPAPVNAVALRHMLCQACQSLRDNGQATNEGYVDFTSVKASIYQALGHEVADSELLAISETEGSAQNGGGSFDSVGEGGQRLMRWVSGAGEKVGALGAPGDIGSPVIGAGRS